MTGDPFARALAALERPVQPRPEFAEQLLALLEAQHGAPLAPSPVAARRTWLRPLVAVAAGVAVVLLAVTLVVTLPGGRSAAAALADARAAVRDLPPVHVAYTTRTDDRAGVVTTDVSFADPRHWSQRVGDGSFTVTDGTLVGAFTPSPPVFSVRRYGELQGPVTESGLGVLSPEVMWQEGGRSGVPPKTWFERECTVRETRFLERAVDRLSCDHDRLQAWLDRDTGLLLRVKDVGVERVVTRLELRPEFRPGVFTVRAPEGAIVLWVGGAPVPPAFATKVTARTIQLAEVPYGLTAAPDGVWVATQNRTGVAEGLQLHRLDATGTVAATVPVPDRFDQLLLAEGRLWLSAALGADVRGPSWVRPYDPLTGRALAARTVVAPGGGSEATMATTPGVLWFAGGPRTTRQYAGGRSSEDGALARIDLATGRVTTRDLGGDTSYVASGLGALWVAVNDWSAEPGPDVTVMRLDPVTGRRTGAFHVPARGVPTVLVPGDRYLYVLSVLGQDEGLLLAIDPSTTAVVARRQVLAGALAYGEGQLWLTDALRNRAQRLDPRTLRPLRTVAVSSGPYRAVVSAGALWVLGYRDSRVTVVPLGTR